MRDSIELGLDRLARHDTPRSVVLTPGDYPGIKAEFVAQLVEYAARMPDRIVIPTPQRPAGPSDRLTLAHRGPDSFAAGRRGRQCTGGRHGDSVVELEIASPEIVADLDTPDDLQQWMQRQDSGGRSLEDPECELQIPDSKIADSRVPIPDRSTEPWFQVSRARSAVRPREGSGRAV